MNLDSKKEIDDSSSDSSSDSDSSLDSDSSSDSSLDNEFKWGDEHSKCKTISLLGYNNNIFKKLNNYLDCTKEINKYTKICPSNILYNKIFYLEERTNKVMLYRNKKFIRIGYFIKFGQNEEKEAPFIFSGDKYTIVRKIKYKKYLLQLCIITNKIYYPNKNNIWVHVANYQKNGIIWNYI